MESPEKETSGDNKNILLIVSISIISINILLIYKVIVQARSGGHGSNRAKHLVVILQACGDIILVLFPFNIIYSGLLFGPIMEIVCSHIFFAYTYIFHLLPFTHATGIIVLTAASFFFWGRHGIHPTFLSHGNWFSPRNFLASLIPWILGALTVFPLILVGFDFDLCAAADYSMPRIEHLFWMSIFLPGLLAIVTSCAYMLSSKSKENLVSKPLHTSFSNHAAAYLIHKFEGNLPTYNEAIQARKDDMKLILDKFDCNRLNVNENISDSTIVISQLSENSNGCRDYALGHYSLQERDELLKTEDGNRTLQAEDISSKICWEKRSRFVAAFISCVCSMPCAVLALIFLSDNSENMWPKTTQIATGLESLYRLHVLRSLISPLLWINEYISI